MLKCYGELMFILSYIAVIFIFIVGVIYQSTYGKPYSVLLEFAIAFGID
jgi:hypothetical protein